jgi:hypothetical protein
LLLGAALASAAGNTVGFNRDVRPIMSDTCFRCHGPDKSSRMAGLRLDIRAEALKRTPAGVTPIVPGKPEESAIIDRIFTKNQARLMPPKFSHKVLSEAQKETIRRWVAEGAVYEGHWAFEPVKRPEAPAVKGPVRNPIDAFVQARLTRGGLAASAEADRRTLIRRVTLDLTGLPPTPREVRAFVDDPSPNAYEKVVDRLLASPRYAEKQAMHWLDAARYADTTGFHGDTPFPAWPYRDYVLRAFRDNKPFDQFTREQLAGDLIPGATLEQKIASAYNRINRSSSEGGLQPKEYLAKYAADRVRTLSSVWLGLTMGCAECHDHKFDPVATRDFYSMKAFFADIEETGLIHSTGPMAYGARLPLPSEEQSRRLAELKQRIFRTSCLLDDAAERMDDRRKAWEKQILAWHESGRLAWRFQRPVSAKSANGAKLAIYNDEPVESNFYLVGGGAATLSSERKRGNGLIVAGGPNPDNETYTVVCKPGEGTWTALGVEVGQDESLPGARLSRGADHFVLTEVEAELSPDGKTPGERLDFVLATHDGFGQPVGYPPMAAIDVDPKTGWAIAYGEGRSPFMALRFTEKVKTGPDAVLTVRLRHDSDLRKATIGRFRLALSEGEYSYPESGIAVEKARLGPSEDLTITLPADRGLPKLVREALSTPETERDLEQRRAALEHFQWASPELEQVTTTLAKLKADLELVQAQIPEVVVTRAVEPRETRILPRGNWMDDSGEIVEPAVPVFLGKLDTRGPRATRLDLANWIVSKDNPLTARVFVNRMWRQFFGTGLSKVLDDIGSQGEWPAHPELLDWLAAEFMQPSWQAEGAHPWDVKHIIRVIVTSHTYRQSSRSTPQLDERDPDNRLLARQSRLRVEAEVVRDIALAVSGLLAEKFGGPSVRPPQPDGYLLAMNFPKREYSSSRGADQYRRGLYTFWQRTFLHPSLLAFDAATREECTVNRPNSNTPLQALVLLNDPVFVEAARVFAQNMLNSGQGFEQQLRWAFLRALGRGPDVEERQVLRNLYRKSLEQFRAAPAEAKAYLAVGEAPLPKQVSAPRLAAMTTVARAILNLHETITRN